jgi:probable F420-dependent oxidoreductase
MRFVVATSFSDPAHYLPMARCAEECGWDWMTLSDHVVHPESLASKYPYTEDGEAYWGADNPWPDPWVTIGAMAAVTERIRFMTNVFILPARNPILVAKEVGTAAVLSRGRVALGIGVGWMREEFEVLGQDFSTRGKRADEQIEILRLLWSGRMVEHHGRHYRFPRLQMSPAPPTPIPVFVGGVSRPALARAARCDGWISVIHSLDEIRGYVGTLRELRADYGKAKEPFEVFVSSDEAQSIDGLRRLEDAGATGVITMPWLLYGLDPTSLAEKCEGIRRFSDDVIAKWTP